MIEKLNYISDEELEQLICQVEQEELVTAPPDLAENILKAVTEVKPKTSKKKEFHAYCFRVITSVAAAVALVFLLPELTERMNLISDKSVIAQAAPSYEEVVTPVPLKADVVTVNTVPSKEEVLDDTGFFEKVLHNTGWFNKD